jgi:glycerophosphoryl diester phosphodiesterase
VKPYSFNISQALVRNGTVTRIRERGYRCWVWTVNAEDQMQRFISEEVDAIITDDPAKLRKLLESPPSPPQPF